jgi:hypothetical protein
MGRTRSDLMRTMFWIYFFLALSGVAVYSVVGLTHH